MHPLLLVFASEHPASSGVPLGSIIDLWPWLVVLPITYLVARTGAAKELRSIQKDTIETWESRAEVLEKDLGDAQRDITELRRQIDHLTEAHRLELAAAEARVQHAHGELDGARRELGIVRAARDEALRRLGAAEQELADARTHIDHLRAAARA